VADRNDCRTSSLMRRKFHGLMALGGIVVACTIAPTLTAAAPSPSRIRRVAFTYRAEIPSISPDELLPKVVDR